VLKICFNWQEIVCIIILTLREYSWVLQIVESHEVSKQQVLALAYCKELHWILAAGAEGVIKVISLAHPRNTEGMKRLPTALYGHTDKITALVVLKNYVCVSASHDRCLRFWDLHTMVFPHFLI
jgi:WD40 repeat protein